MRVFQSADLPLIRTFKGIRSGPRIALIGGIHGDEPSGAQAVADLISGQEPLSVEQGEVVVILANPTAVRLNKRAVNANLNALICRDSDFQGPEASLATVIMDTLDGCDASLDLHEHKDPNVGSLAITELGREAALALNPDVLISGLDLVEPGATDSYMAGNSRIGVCFELGPIGRDHRAMAHAAISRFLSVTGVTPARCPTETTVAPLELRAAALIRKRSATFRYAHGVESCSQLPPGPFAWDGDTAYTTAGQQTIVFPRPEGPVGSSVGILAHVLAETYQ